MARPSEQQQEALAGLLGLGSHSARKSHYPELLARLEELEAERNRYKWLFEHAVHGIFQASLGQAARRQSGAGADARLRRSATGALVAGGHGRATVRRRRGRDATDPRAAARARRPVRLRDAPLAQGRQSHRGIDEPAAQARRGRIGRRFRRRHHRAGPGPAAPADHERGAGAAGSRAHPRAGRAQPPVAPGARRRRSRQPQQGQVPRRRQPRPAATAQRGAAAGRHPARTGLPAAELQLVERTHLALEGAETLLTDLLEIARLDQSAIRPDLDDYSLDELLAPLASEFEEVARAAGLALRARIRDWQCAPTRACCRGSCATCSATPAATPSAAACCWGAPAWRQGTPGGVGHWPGHPRRPVAGDLPRVQPTGRRARFRAPWRRTRLAIVDRIAGILGYRIEVHSTPGRGSLFAIEVPLVRKPARPAPARRLRGFRLVIRCRDGGCWWWTTRPRFSMSALLGQWGCEVLTATDLKRARARSMAARRMRSWSTTTWTTALPVASCWAPWTTARRSPR